MLTRMCHILLIIFAELSSATWYDRWQDPHGGIKKQIGTREEDWASKSWSGRWNHI